MRKFKRIAIQSLVLIVAVFVGRAASQQEKPAPGGGGGGMGDMQAAMQKYIATIKPSEHHKKLDPFVGKWNITIRMWMMGPGGPPTETKGKSEIKWVLGDRFVQEDLDAEM